jgi:DNA polymerase-3 subunit delta'
MKGEVIGHQREWNFLQAALTNARLAQAYLFFGPEGIGKKQVALRLAQAVNCLSAQFRPCRSCSSCKKLDNQTHPDVTIIYPDGNKIKIDQIRELQRDMMFAPLEGRRKLYILDDADTMTAEAANCLLKSLEEPPHYVTIILVAANPSLLPATILSRCQRLRFLPLSLEQTAALLADQGCDQDEARVLAAISEASPACAWRLKQGRMVEETEEFMTRVIGGPPLTGQDTMAYAKRWAKSDYDPKDLVRLLFLWIRDLLALKEGVPGEQLFHRRGQDALRAGASHWSRDRLIELGDELNRFGFTLDRNVNRQLALDLMLRQIGCRKS